MAKILVLYPQPPDPGGFDRYYFGTHVPLAKKIPGLKRFEISRGPIAGDPDAGRYHLVAILSFASMEALQRALETPECKAATEDLKNFAPEGVRILVFESEALA